ncbi:hypothetical protein M5K25_020360 [Dendrobium thyrsiflorum]|uniref:Uncharacterized protein n=1 Tax=Dendrobium thyrsiflorum TaxID=117978 RepID=A0ABD0UGQ8_DENTH
MCVTVPAYSCCICPPIRQFLGSRVPSLQPDSDGNGYLAQVLIGSKCCFTVVGILGGFSGVEFNDISNFEVVYRNFHTPAVIIGGIFALIALIISLLLIFEHLRSYSNPDEQKWIIGILFMVPVYASESVKSAIDGGFSQSHAVTQFPTSVVTPKPIRPILPTHESNQGMPPTPSSRHLEHHPASFVETNRGHHYSRDHLSFSNLRVAAPPCRSLPSLDGRTSLGSSVGSVHYDSPLRPTHNHPSQPLASPDLDPASVNLIENRIRKEMSPESETECIYFVDANDITDDKGFFEDETEVTKLDSLYDLNPDLGVLEPLDLDTLVHLDPNDIKDIPLDKVCLDDINLISKEADLTLNPLKLSSEDSDFIISPNKTTPNNSGLILNNSDVNNLESEVSQLDLLHELDPNLIDPESFELRVITKHDPIDNINMSSEDSNLNLKDSEPNFNNEPPLTLLDPNLGVAPLDLHLKESVLPDWADHITLPTDLNENISPHFHVVPTSTLDTLPRLLSPIPTVQGDGGGNSFMVDSGVKTAKPVGCCNILLTDYALLTTDDGKTIDTGGEERAMELLEKGTSKQQLTEQLLKGDEEKGILHRSSFYDFFFNPTVLGKDLYTIVKFGLVQYMILKTLCSFSALLLELFGVYGDGEFKWYKGWLLQLLHIYMYFQRSHTNLCGFLHMERSLPCKQ